MLYEGQHSCRTILGWGVAGNATGDQEAVDDAPRNQQPALNAREALMSVIRDGVGCSLW